MTFAVLTNIATMILCIAVLIQTVRLMRALDTVKGGALSDVVGALDVSTGEARRVLTKLTDLLRGDIATTTRTLSEGKSMIEELTVMTGIANAIAERIVEVASASNRVNELDGPPALASPASPAKASPQAAARRQGPPSDGVQPRRRSRKPDVAVDVAAA